MHEPGKFSFLAKSLKIYSLYDLITPNNWLSNCQLLFDISGGLSSAFANSKLPVVHN